MVLSLYNSLHSKKLWLNKSGSCVHNIHSYLHSLSWKKSAKPRPSTPPLSEALEQCSPFLSVQIAFFETFVMAWPGYIGGWSTTPTQLNQSISPSACSCYSCCCCCCCCWRLQFGVENFSWKLGNTHDDGDDDDCSSPALSTPSPLFVGVSELSAYVWVQVWMCVCVWQSVQRGLGLATKKF